MNIASFSLTFAVMIVDLDSGPLGEVTFEVEEAYQDRFRIDLNADKKSGIMRSNG